MKTNSPERGNRAGPVVQTADRALEILGLLEVKDRSVGEVAVSLGIDNSTASRLVRTLRDREFVVKDPETRKIRLGPKIGALGHAYKERFLAGRDFGAVLDHLAATTGETVVLTAFDGKAATYIDKRESQNSLRTSSRIGDRVPLHAGASGKAILAYVPGWSALVASQPLERYTDHTMLDVDALSADLAEVRSQGFAISIEEINVGVVGIGVPIIGAGKQPEGSVSVTAPVVRFSVDVKERIVALLREVI